MIRWLQLGFQDGIRLFIIELIEFHDYIILVLTGVLVLVGCAFIRLGRTKYRGREVLDSQVVEGVWTIIPGVILIFLALPSLHLLYLRDEIFRPRLTVKAIGHQWYWRYEYRDLTAFRFDSYMVGADNLVRGDYRLLEVDNRLVLPYGVESRILVTVCWCNPCMDCSVYGGKSWCCAWATESVGVSSFWAWGILWAVFRDLWC